MQQIEMDKGELYANHLILNGTRTRRVLIDKCFIPCKVLSVRRMNNQGKVDYPTTYQTTDTAVWELYCTSGDNGIIRVNQLQPSDNGIIDIKLINGNITDWLRDVDYLTYHNFLPAGCGWDGVYSLVERKKFEKLRYVLGLGKARYKPDGCSTHLLEHIARAGVMTSAGRVCLDWRQAESYRWSGKLDINDVINKGFKQEGESHLIVLGITSDNRLKNINPQLVKRDNGQIDRQYDSSALIAEGFNRFIIVDLAEHISISRSLRKLRLIVFR